MKAAGKAKTGGNDFAAAAEREFARLMTRADDAARGGGFDPHLHMILHPDDPHSVALAAAVLAAFGEGAVRYGFMRLMGNGFSVEVQFGDAAAGARAVVAYREAAGVLSRFGMDP